eukprot:11705788-Karenia_brevis.AAC.1
MAQSTRSFLTGVRLGPGCKLPRTPAVFERKTRWRKLDGMDDVEMPSSREKYSSAIENVAAVEAMFKEDVELGHMRMLSDSEALKEFGVFHTAAIGALEKSDDTFRVIHDGTHGV